MLEHTPRQPLRRAALGAALSLGSPLGWIVIETLVGRDPAASFHADPGVYLYMTLGTMGVFTAFGYYVGLNENKLALLAIRDSLTGLYNPRFFHERLHEAFATARRMSLPLAVLQIDLDHFKQVNDTRGHQAGDLVLQAVGRQLAESSREGETVARVGGEEFSVILEGTDEDGAVLAAQRFLDALRGLEISAPGGDPLRVTASVGAASSADLEGDAWHLHGAADQAMYAAKKAGRNRICRHTEITAPSGG